MKTKILSGHDIEFKPLIIAFVISIIGAIYFYQPIEFILKALGVGIDGGGFFFEFPIYFNIFDFSFSAYLIFILSLFFDWKTALRYWGIGYFLLVLIFLFLTGGLIIEPVHLLFVLLLTSAGFLLGQGVRFLLVRAKVVR